MKSSSSPTLRWLAVALLVLTALPVVLSLRLQPPTSSPSLRGDSEWVKEDEIVVDLKDDASTQDIQALEDKFGIDLRFNSEYADDDNLMVAHVDPSRQSELVAELRQEPTVEVAEPEYEYKALMVPNDPRYNEQWNFKMIDMEKAWDSARGKGIVVAVIDTGVAFEEDTVRCRLAKDFKQTRFVEGHDFVHNDKHPFDDHGHGTHVAGTIAESTNNGEGVAGIAFEAKIMPLKVLSASGSGSAADIADAIRFAADNGANVINMSLGGPFPSGAMEKACQYAAKKGVVIVCAAGNSGREGVGYPAAFKECIAVSAVGPSKELTRYSSYGKEVAIAAPGGDKSMGEKYGVLQNTIYQGNDDYYYFNGTSMASPHVAGVAALIMSKGVKDPAQVKAVLQKSAEPKSPKNKYGAGILNAAKAVELAGSWTPVPTEETQPLLTESPTDEVTEGSIGVAAAWKPRLPKHKQLIDLLVKIGLALLISGVCIAVGKFKKRTKGAAEYPLVTTLTLLIGILLPDAVMLYFGQNHWANLLAHSVVIPALLYSVGLNGKRVLQLLTLFTMAVTLHLAWDVWQKVAPFADLGWHALPWLCANIVVGISVTIAALRRSAARVL